RQRLSEQDKLKLGSVAKEVYESGIRLSLTLSQQTFSKKEYLSTAFEFCERSKSAVLLEAITETKAKEFSGIPNELLQLEDSLKDEISYLERKLAEPENAEDQQLKSLIFTYQNAYRSFINKLEKEYPKYFNLKYSHDLASIEEIQSKLNDNSAMLSYFLGNDQLFAFLITSKNAKSFRFTIDKDFEKNATGLRNAIKYNVKSAFNSYSKKLYEQLIPKIPGNISQLVILPDGVLGTIPFEALINPQDNSSSYKETDFLIRKYHISYDYSATLFTQKTYNEDGSNPEILLVAPVEFDTNETQMAALPGSEKEVKEIRYLFMGNNCQPTVQAKRQASETNLKSEDLSKYQYLHFATHGFVNESEPALSKIFLRPDQKEDGSLYAGEIYNLKINADLVTLSACETGLGKVAKGEGIVGLSRALQYAGANNIIVSLWQVADESTSEMMIEFYKYNLTNYHHGYNTALRKAKLSLLNSDNYNRPYYWAPFILVGM
ncbi:MAG: CHAT domain-containing protein, partial [Bacteroidota bacterium]